MKESKLRLEEGVKEQVYTQAAGLIDRIERALISLSGAGPHLNALVRLRDDVQSLGMTCRACRNFDELTVTTVEFDTFLAHLITNPEVIADPKTGGLLLQVVSTFRHALSNLGQTTRSAQLLPKLLGDLRRVMSVLRVKYKKPEPQTKAAPIEVLPNDEINLYRKSFLADESGDFAKINTLVENTDQKFESLQNNKALTEELFRLFHTVKGNAFALGVDALTQIAHGAEECLQEVRTNPSLASVATGKLLVAKAKELNEARRSLNGESQSLAVEVKAETLPATPATFFLSAVVGGQPILLPCDSVACVLRDPTVLSVPKGRSSWLGLIRSEGQLIPLVSASAIFPETPLSQLNAKAGWVIVVSSRILSELAGDSALPVSGSLDLPRYFSFPVDAIGDVVEFNANTNSSSSQRAAA
jgi:HPt (histidine-containing phosphotransfer) domain-containing protein/chemotaxis signal transduction protein